MSHSMVVGYDGSACSQDALAAAVEVAGGASDAEIIVVYCHEIPAGLACELDPTCAAAHELREFERHIQQEVEPMLAAAAERVRRAGIKAETVLAWDDPCDALGRVATEHGCAAIVVGSHGEGALAGTLSRSPCYRLLHHSPVPVMVVPRRESRRAGTA